jgi:hypothetical protein
MTVENIPPGQRMGELCCLALRVGEDPPHPALGMDTWDWWWGGGLCPAQSRPALSIAPHL